MTREEAKRMLPIIQAFAEGKTIELCCDSGATWVTDYDPSFKPELCYRIKSELKYRPFKNQEECWNELQKHVPYGILKNKETGKTAKIYGFYTEIYSKQFKIAFFDISCNCCKTANSAYYIYKFVDDTPFGIKEE